MLYTGLEVIGMALDHSLIKDIPLFAGIKEDEFGALLGCVGAQEKKYAKGEFISLAGDEIHTIGVVLEGRVYILKEDVFGNKAILNDLEAGAAFGESFICGGSYALTVSIQAAEDCRVLFMSFDRVMHTCPSACQFHNTLITNMVVMIAHKNIKLIEKLEITTKHSLREKVLAYLSQLVQEQGTANVVSPMGRVDLADFLGVDRSALTRELNRMREDGLIEFDRNSYVVLGIAEKTAR